MEKSDLELIEQCKGKEPELKQLWDEHLELEEQLERFNTRVYLSTAEEIERKTIQKKKLRGRDKIERLLIKLRKDTGQS